MLTGADLDTKRSLDGALVQISLPSQTQTSRQIAWANVIGVTSPYEKKKEKRKKEWKKERKKETLTRSPQQTSGSSRLYFLIMIMRKVAKKKGGVGGKQGAEKVSTAGFAKLQWSLLPIRSVSLAGVKLSEV